MATNNNSVSDTQTLGASLEQFAKDIMREAMAKDEEGQRVALSDKIEALKTVTTTYATLRKHPDEPGEENNQGDGFDFTRGINTPAEEPSNDSNIATIRSRRRPG